MLYSASSMLFPLNNGDANISGVELNAELLDVAKFLILNHLFIILPDQLSFHATSALRIVSNLI